MTEKEAWLHLADKAHTGNKFLCVLVDNITVICDNEKMGKRLRNFSPRKKVNCDRPWWAGYDNYFTPSRPTERNLETRQHRVLACLFLAAMCGDDDD